MDDIHSQSQFHETLPKTTSRFLCCFGFSDKPLSDKNPKDQPDPIKKKKHGFSLLRFRFKKSGRTKTVPVDTGASEKVHANNLVHSSKSKSKWKSYKVKSEREIPATNLDARHQGPTAATLTSGQKSKERNLETIHENGKPLDHMGSPKDHTTTTRLSFRRRVDSIRTGNSHPGSPNAKPKPNRTGSIKRSTSFPVPSVEILAKPPAVSRVPEKKAHKKNYRSARNLDPVIGMSIIAVTLAIMLLWGRLCAILCTSAWFYFVPSLREVIKRRDTGETGRASGEPDLNSEEYKKKVVLEGLLERSRRSFS